MRRYLLALYGISAAALLCCSAAFADTFTFSFSGSGFTGSGTFTASSTSTSGQFLINTVTGMTNGVSIANILAPGVYPPPGDEPNDNLLYYPLVAGGALDIQGFSYDTTDSTDYNIYYYDGVYSLATGAGPSDDPLAVPTYNLDSFTVKDTTTGATIVGPTPRATPTPEPGSLVLLATGALGMATVIRRRLAV